MKQIIYVGHRGSKLGNGVENTKEAYLDGVKAGYQALETDVRVTLDQVFIASHDPNLTRLTTNSKIKSDIDVNNSNYDDFKDIELSEIYQGELRSGGYICLFDEYLDICKQNNMIPIIELKWTNGIYSSNDDFNNHDYSNIDELIQKIYNHGLENDAYVMTSMLGCLDYVHKKYPNIKLQWLCNKLTKTYLPYCAERGINLDVEYTQCDEEVMKFAKEHNMLVNIWTLNDETLLQHYLDLGVDMITTDCIKPR